MLWLAAAAFSVATLAGCKSGEAQQSLSAATESGNGWCKQDYLVLTGRVVDAANILPPESESRLLNKLTELERKTGHQLVVATTPSLQGKRIEDYSICLARHWKIGRTGNDDGVLLLIAPSDRKLRIEVGYGLEKALRDDEAAAIIRKAMIPAFEANELAKGVEVGADLIMMEIGR